MFVAVLVAGAVVAAALLLQEGLGERALGTTVPPGAPSGAWMCPHGGGERWETSLSIANPGEDEVAVRVTSFGEGKPTAPEEVSVPAGATATVVVPSGERGASSMVEYFGGWVAAGWVARASLPETGVAAEPCAPQAGTRWTLPDNTTEAKDERPFVVVMNPFASDAVIDVTALTQDQPPAKRTESTDFVLPAFRSAAFELDDFIEGEPTVAATVDVSIGRVAAAALGVSGDRGIRSTIGWFSPAPERTILPGTGDAGPSDLVTVNPGPRPSSFGATLLAERGLQVPKGLQEATEDSESGSTITVQTAPEAPSTIVVRPAGGDEPVFAARRTTSVGTDLGATSGAPEAGDAWVVLPATGGPPQSPVLCLTNPGTDDAEVTLTTLPQGDVAPHTSRIQVRAGTTVQANKGLLAATPEAGTLVIAETGTVVPAAASYSQGQNGVGAYAVSVGVPVPGGQPVGP